MKKIKNGFGYAVLYSINYCVLRRWIGLENAKFHWKIPFLGCFVKRCLHLLQPGFFPKFSMIVGDMYRNVTDWYILPQSYLFSNQKISNESGHKLLYVVLLETEIGSHHFLYFLPYFSTILHSENVLLDHMTIHDIINCVS